MKHVKLFEDFTSYENSNLKASESFIVLTGNEGNAFYAISHIKNKEDINLLRMRFSGNEDVFDAIPYTGKNYVGSGYSTLTPYETADDGIRRGNYYEFYSDNQGDQNVEPGEGEGILWGVPPVGFTIYADKGYATTITNDEYLKQYGQQRSGEMKSGFIVLSGSDNGFNISHVGNENELRELTSKLKSISYVDVYPPIKDNGEKLAYAYDGDDFRQCKSPKDVDYEFFINEDGEIIEDAGNGEGYLWEIPEIGFTLVGQPGGFFSKVSNSQFANKL
jgi:hypothetical protein